MATPSVTQNSGMKANSGDDNDTHVFTGVAAGAALVAFGSQPASADRNYSVSDDVDGSWTTYSSTAGNRHTWISYILNHTGGDVTITMTSSPAASAWNWLALEVANATTFEVTDENVNASNASTFYSAASGGQDIPANGIGFVSFVSNANAGTFTVGSGWTIAGPAQSQVMFQLRPTTTLVSGNRGECTISNSRHHAGRMLILSDGGGGGGPTGQPHIRRLGGVPGATQLGGFW